MEEYDLLDEPRAAREHGTAGIGAIALAAAVGAGVALLLATDAGRDTRKRMARKLSHLELGEHVERLGGAAAERLAAARARGRGRSRGGRRRHHALRSEPKENGALYAALGTVAGAALAALLTPQGGRETREWIGHTFDDLGNKASLRWREHRARHDSAKEPADLEVERLNGSEV